MLKKILLGVPRKLIIFNACFTIIWGLLNAYFTVFLSKITAANLEQNEFLITAFYFIGYILVWELVEFLCDYLDSISHVYIRNSTYDYYYKKLYFTKPEALQQANTGYISGILTQLIERKCVMMFGFLLGGVSVVYTIYLIIYIGNYSAWFSLIVLLLVLLGIITRLLCSSFIENSLKKMTVARGEQTHVFMDGINNIATVQKLRGLKFMESKAALCKDDNIKATKNYTIGNEIGFCLYKTINYMLCPICMFVALYLYNKDQSFPIVEFMAYLSIVTVQLVHNVRNIADLIKNYNLFSVTQQEMDKMIEDQSMIYTSTSIGSKFHRIELKDIVFQYNTNQGSVTIEIPEFFIRKGETLCITGESGQGKTTLLKLLSGMIETQGKLRIDGDCIPKNIDAVYIAQDTEMLDMSLYDNLTFGNTAISEEELVSLLKEVGMLEWYEKQEKGMDTILGERGVFVSTGQRQRLNILRGLLIDKEIYLLDEPTSNVDDATEEKLIHLIKERLAGKTVIIVTHKEKIRQICDREYCFKENRIVEVPL